MRASLYGLVMGAILLCGPVQAQAPEGQAQAQAAEPEDSPCFLPDIFSHRLEYRETVDLNGEWQFRRDPGETGRDQGWHEGQAEAEGLVTVPGAPQAQGYGEAHPHQRTHFMEPFWLWRTFSLRGLAGDERAWLRVGGVLPAAEVYVNGHCVGYTKSSRTQERVDVTEHVQAGENLLAVKVCNPPTVRLDGLLLWNEGTQHWMGLYRPVKVEITRAVSIIDAYIQPRLAEDAADVSVRLSQAPESALVLDLSVMDNGRPIGRCSVDVPAGSADLAARVKLDAYTPWSPEHPQLYVLEMALRDGAAEVDRAGLRFGMREIHTEGAKFYLNGRPLFWRVFGDDMYFPETLCPSADIEWYRTRLERARAYGMNGVKGCVETIPQDCIEACDEAGILIIQEMPFGLSTLRANRYTIEEPFISFYANELDGLVRVSRNHASVVAYSMSSELEFSNQTQQSFEFFSQKLPAQTRALAPHALVIDCTGYVNKEETEKGVRDTDFYASVHPQWVKEVLEEVDMESDGKHPLILHEYNWWSCYPDPADKAKYDGAQLLPFWFDGLVETARANGQEHLIPTYRKNSLWLQAMARKDGIEYARRNPGIEGYILWLLIDFGHWCEGLLDDFWQPKNVSATEFMQSNGETVVLLAEEGNRCLSMKDMQRIPVGVSHYGEADYPGAKLLWTVARSGQTLSEGTLEIEHLEEGTFARVGDVVFCGPQEDIAYRVELGLELRDAGSAIINTNQYSFWLFPDVPEELAKAASPEQAGTTIMGDVFLRLGKALEAAIPEKTALVVADRVDKPLVEFVSKGGRCLVFTRAAEIENRTLYYGDTTFYGLYRTIPWNAGNAGNSGTVIHDHPALASFPHEGFCDLNWVWLLRGFYPMHFEPLRSYGVEPIIRNIDSYRSNRNNAFLLEFRVGEGGVAASTIGVLPNLAERIEAQYLLACLINYVRSDAFAPGAQVPEADFHWWFSPKAGGFKTRTSVDLHPD